MNRLIILLFAMIGILSCKKEENTLEIKPTGVPIPTTIYFVFRDVKTKKTINKQENEAVPRFFFMNKGKKTYVDEYISPNWGAIRYSEGANSIKWVSGSALCSNSPQNDIQVFFFNMTVVSVSFGDKVETFDIEWKGKNLGTMSMLFDGEDKYGRPVIKDVIFNNKKSEKEYSTCPNAFIFDVEL